ncbi:urease accessory protein UreD [Williamsia sterculiae]|uniref:Urease accessory protein n=1 Tax=Williamsia sterculiae TaxID=1344003 RepID=A0A1N7H2J6_9NOCA|nr:urease accessory protein UreD [Williamsia sterculiae]SIS19059.1 urease accessory protein [Williamsia sterculiae]
MHTEVVISAIAGRSPRIHAVGGLAVRQTGPHRLHLVSAAATPLGGDTIRVVVRVAPGARLHLTAVAATMAMPSRPDRTSYADWEVEVGAGGRLLLDPLPTLVAGGADHESVCRVSAAVDASVTVTEAVQIGRTGETAGAWSGRLDADIDGTPVLRHRLELPLADPSRLGQPAAPTVRCAVSTLTHPDPRPTAVSDTEVCARLVLPASSVTGSSPSTTLTTAMGRSLTAVRAAISALDPAPATGAVAENGVGEDRPQGRPAQLA